MLGFLESVCSHFDRDRDLHTGISLRRALINMKRGERNNQGWAEEGVGLQCNVNESQAAPARCSDDLLELS